MRNYPNLCKVTTNLRHGGSFLQENSSNEENLSFLFQYAELQIVDVIVSDSCINLYCNARKDYAVCPYCGKVSSKVHSRYIRTITDLPILGKTCILHVKVRKFFCGNDGCSHKTFSEQPGNELFRYRRRTRRCELQVMRAGITCSSIKASRLLKYAGIHLCNTTILRDIHRTSLPDYKDARRIGVDDWAFRKGIDYGSIVIDLDSGHAIDLLGDRGHDSFKAWLDGHTNVCLVSRDRSTEYSAAIANTGRNICEVADLFHLVKNMSDCVTKVISDNYQSYRELVTRKSDSCENHSDDEKISDSTNEKEDARMVTFKEVKRLQTLGKKPLWIARNLKIARQTATKFCAIDTLQPRKSKCRNRYYSVDSYVEREYAKGKPLSEIYADVVSQGFAGSRTPFYDHYRYLSDGHRGYRSDKQKEELSKRIKPIVKTEPILPIRHLSMIVDREIRGTNLDKEDYSSLMCTLNQLTWFRETFNAASSFYAVMNGTDADQLIKWVDKHKSSSIKQIRTFAKGISLDIEAVARAITTNVRNGITEGFVNKLKEVKRTMYGKAKLELLKRKMMLEYTYFN